LGFFLALFFVFLHKQQTKKIRGVFKELKRGRKKQKSKIKENKKRWK